MKKEEVQQRIVNTGIVPVIRAGSVEEALAAAEAVCAGGITVVEITMTVPGAFQVISELTRTGLHDILIGAGTVLDAGTAKRCVDAGAQFLVSPGLDLETVAFANDESVLIMAGALTPTEIITAWKGGADFVKVFPCSAMGGASYIKSLKAPLPQVPLVPTGGVNLNTLAEYLRAGAAAVGVGGELVSAAALKSGNTAAITESARKYVAVFQAERGQPIKTTTTLAGD